MEKEYKDFCKKLVKEIRKKFAEPNYRIELHTALKNNSVKYDGLTIYASDCKLSPNFYLQTLYEQYKNGFSMDEIINSMEKKYYEMQIKHHGMNLNISYEYCKDKIIFRLISRTKNEELLSDVPFIRFLDLAVVFYVFVHQEKDEIGSFQISKRLMEKWQVNEEMLMKKALENTKRFFPTSIQNMYQMIREMFGKKNMSKEVEEYFFDEVVEEPGNEPVILTNESGINGATFILYEDALKAVSDYFQGNYYILPSSIHEVLALPCTISVSHQELQKMVQEVNESCLAEEEFLSEHVYLYDAHKEKLEICI